MASNYRDKGEKQQALSNYLKSLDIRKEVFGDENMDVAVTYNDIAKIYEDAEENLQAFNYYQNALHSMLSIVDPNHPNFQTLLNNIRHFMQLIGDKCSKEPYKTFYEAFINKYGEACN